MSAPDREALDVRERYRLPCGCEIEIARDQSRSITLARTIHQRSGQCPSRAHTPGARVYLWELLPRMHTQS